MGNLSDIELTGCERFTSYFSEEIHDRAYYYVMHSFSEASPAEMRKIRSKIKKIKKSNKKQRRRQTQSIFKHYCR